MPRARPSIARSVRPAAEASATVAFSPTEQRGVRAFLLASVLLVLGVLLVLLVTALGYSARAQRAEDLVDTLTSETAQRVADAAARLATITPAPVGAQLLAPDTDYPFADPRHWAAFVLFQRNLGFSR